MMTPKGVLKTPKTCSIERIPQLPMLRVLACIGIIVLHTVFAADEYFAESIDSVQYLASRMVENNMMWAVPVFVMVTGTLQLDVRRQLTWHKLFGRYILRVLLALIACCIFFRIFDMIMDGEGFSAPGLGLAFVELLTGHCWGHLWYLYLLIGLYLMLPFYRIIVQQASDRMLWYLGGLYLLFISIIPLIEGFGIPIAFYISESIIYPLYLFLGYMIVFDRLPIGRGTGLLLLIVSTALILTLDYMKYGLSMEVPKELFGYASPLVIAQAIGVFTLISKGWSSYGKASRLVQLLDECSFGIYLIHMIFIRLLFRYMQWDPYQGASVLAMAAVVLGNLVLSFAIVWLLKKIPGVRWVL